MITNQLVVYQYKFQHRKRKAIHLGMGRLHSEETQGNRMIKDFIRYLCSP